MDLLLKYFPQLTPRQQEQLAQLPDLYQHWNDQINVISRKDMVHLCERHILHSLGIAKVVAFGAGSTVLDVGTGGGFPGIPLSILFPQTQFHLVDSIGKKIKVVQAVAQAIGADNVTAEQIRAEQLSDQYDFVVSRAVTQLTTFYGWVRPKIRRHAKANTDTQGFSTGIFYLKGGEVEEEVNALRRPYQIFDLSAYFEESFFETKKVVYVPVGA